MCEWFRDFPVHGQMERLRDRRLAGMSCAQAGVQVGMVMCLSGFMHVHVNRQ